MSIENTLERIATALETLAGNNARAVQAVEAHTATLAEKTDAPKRTRGKAAATAAETTSGASAAETATEADASTAKSEPAVDKETDDLFGEEPPKKEEAKKATIEQVKAALVSVQTALKDKKHAIKLLAKHTTGHAEVLSKLPESSYAALIEEAAKCVKAGKVD